MRITRQPRKSCGCSRRHTVVTTVAILLAFGGTAVALPGKSTVNSGDIKNNNVKSVDIKDGNLLSADLADGKGVGGVDVVDGSLVTVDIADDAVTAVKIAADAVGAPEIAAGAVGADEIATDAVGKDEIASFSVGASEVENFDLTALDVGSDKGNATLNFPVIAVDACSSLSIDPANDDDIGDEVVVVTPGSGFGGAFTVGAEVQNTTNFAVKVCNAGAAPGDPDGTGAIYSWVMFEA